MVFNSFAFAIFGVLFFLLYWGSQPRWRNVLLIGGSYLFYGWWDWRFLSLIIFSSFLDFFLSHRLAATEDDRTRLRLLWLSVVINLGILGVFKYANFFVASATNALQSLGFEANDRFLAIALPVGISFYTFQTISYTFDVYRRRLEPTTNFINFAAYVAYFPQLVAGPIERARMLLPQIEATDRPFPSSERLLSGVGLIMLGLFRKVVIADGLAPMVNDGFANSDTIGWASSLVVVIGFSLQIYGDFAGYTDIARGVSRMLGIELTPNFAQPYLSRNITEFWRRWHISLSNWLRDYLYISLGGNRGTQLFTARNLMITMLLGGLWHGASWNFVVWGLLHGIFLSVHRWGMGGAVPDTDRVTLAELPRIIGNLTAVGFAWIFFRAADFGEAWGMISAFLELRPSTLALGDLLLLVVLGAAAVSIDLLQRSTGSRRFLDVFEGSPALAGAGAGAFLLSLILFSGGSPEPFIYFQF